MRAVRLIEPGLIEVADVAEPAAEEELAVVRVHRAGVCGSDLKMMRGKVKLAPGRVMGHEMVGEIESVPPGSPFAPGTRVLVDPAVACGMCDLCRVGRTNLCRHGGLMGRDVDGVFTEKVAVPPERLLPFPDSLSFREAGLLQVLGTCVHAVNRTPVPFPGGVAAVIGLGVAGQLISQLLTVRGMRVVGITRSEWKRNLVVELGAEIAVEPSRAKAFLDRLTDGRGPDLVVEAVGTSATLATAVDLVGIGGEVLAYGSIPAGEGGLPYYELYRKELTIRHPRAALIGDYAEGIRLAASGALTLDPIITHELGLDDAVEAFRLVEDSSSLKVLMHLD